MNKTIEFTREELVALDEFLNDSVKESEGFESYVFWKKLHSKVDEALRQ